ncbi:acyltransferase [Oxynema sp. CENA135]|uniref:acyltransferase n=1 Tax=Oxynema sp. CENA135 TaxID=984206 RepID=UPI00190DEE9D|nr:acyltransferase [Oxynema sp. CENA135]MBK4731090.1 acyltransferase [Oxynema sp. CENA135]
MRKRGLETTQFACKIPGMPLAVYRELAAHLEQIGGVEVDLIPQTAPDFDYERSQIGGASIRVGEGAETGACQRIEQILNHYRQRYAAN